MKKTLLLLTIVGITLSASAQEKKEEVMKKEKGTYIVNTTTLCDARGFKGSTPLLITYKKKNIVKIEALPNMETPKFFNRLIKEMFPKYENIAIDKSDEVDCVTGATMSSRAVKANVEAANKYYLENK